MANPEALTPRPLIDDIAEPTVSKPETPARMLEQKIWAQLQAQLGAILEAFPSTRIEIPSVVAEMNGWNGDLMQVSLEIDIWGPDGYQEPKAAVRAAVTETLSAYKLQPDETPTIKDEFDSTHINLPWIFKIPVQPKR